jgi:hypothetical protein
MRTNALIESATSGSDEAREEVIVSLGSDDLVTLPTGATSSKLDVDYTLAPLRGFKAVAAAMTKGAEKHGRHNWRRGIDDETNLAHALNHLHLYAIGDTTEDHLANAGCRILMLLETRELHA